MGRPGVTDRDTGFAEFVRRMNTISGKPNVKVGFLADKNEERTGDGRSTNVEVAAANEFGTRTIPARPAIGSSFDAHAPEYEKMAGILTRAIVDGKTDTARALGLMGAKAAGDIKQTITQGAGVPPPNAPETVKRKGHDRTLVGGSVKGNYAGGQMVGAVTWAVEGQEK